MKKYLVLAAMAVVASVEPSFAGTPFPTPMPVPPQVPEIDTLSGLAAVVAVGGTVALIWERRKRK